MKAPASERSVLAADKVSLENHYKGYCPLGIFLLTVLVVAHNFNGQQKLLQGDLYQRAKARNKGKHEKKTRAINVKSSHKLWVSTSIFLCDLTAVAQKHDD